MQEDPGETGTPPTPAGLPEPRLPAAPAVDDASHRGPSVDHELLPPEIPLLPQSVKLILLGIALFGLFVVWVLVNQRPGVMSTSDSGLGPGERLPAIEADGWLNSPGPTSQALKGSVVLVDYWAFWCGPCAEEAPHLVKVYEEYHPKGVIFIGLTSERHDRYLDSKMFLDRAGITWPNGYGANSTLMALGARAIPAVWVADRDGIIVWNSASSGTLESALDKALAKPRSKKP